MIRLYVGVENASQHGSDHLNRRTQTLRVREALRFVELEQTYDLLPAALSGGMRRRVAIARAMAARPGLLLFDDPTTGLDPITAATVNDEVVKLRDLEHVTSVLVTHQIRDAFYVSNHVAERRDGRVEILDVEGSGVERARFMVLHQGRIYFEGSGVDLLASDDTHVMLMALQKLGVHWQQHGESQDYAVDGTGGTVNTAKRKGYTVVPGYGQDGIERSVELLGQVPVVSHVLGAPVGVAPVMLCGLGEGRVKPEAQLISVVHPVLVVVGPLMIDPL